MPVAVAVVQGMDFLVDAAVEVDGQALFRGAVIVPGFALEEPCAVRAVPELVSGLGRGVLALAPTVMRVTWLRVS